MQIMSIHLPLKFKTFAGYSSRHIIQKPYFSSRKLCSPQKNTAKFSEYFSPISKGRLAATSDSNSNGEIQLHGDLRQELMPKHVAIILDGNGRWAKNRGLPVKDGHRAGLENLKKLILQCCKFGIKVLTVYAFSTENWNRSKEEVEFVMRLVDVFIRSIVTELILEQNLRFCAIGEKSRLPEYLQLTISSAEESSKNNKGIHFVMALSYGGRSEIIEASTKLSIKVENGKIRAEDINESLFEQELMTNVIEYPNPDMLIRTSGELRISNFMLWQLAYSEFYFANTLFPDFGEPEFVEALSDFQQRKRRFGKR